MGISSLIVSNKISDLFNFIYIIRKQVLFYFYKSVARLTTQLPKYFTILVIPCPKVDLNCASMYPSQHVLFDYN